MPLALFSLEEKKFSLGFVRLLWSSNKSHNLAWNVLSLKAAAQKLACFCKQIFSLFCHHSLKRYFSCAFTVTNLRDSFSSTYESWQIVTCSQFLGVVTIGQLLVVVVFSAKLLFLGSSQLNCMLKMVSLKMDRFKVINEVFNRKLSQTFTVNSVYDGGFQSEIEPNVPFMSKKSMQLFVKTFRKIDRSIVMVMQWSGENRTRESKGLFLFITETHWAKIFSAISLGKVSFKLVSEDFQVVSV